MLFFSISQSKMLQIVFHLIHLGERLIGIFSLLTLNLPSNQKRFSKHIHAMSGFSSLYFHLLPVNPRHRVWYWKAVETIDCFIFVYSHLFSCTYLRFQLINFCCFWAMTKNLRTQQELKSQSEKILAQTARQISDVHAMSP